MRPRGLGTDVEGFEESVRSSRAASAERARAHCWQYMSHDQAGKRGSGAASCEGDETWGLCGGRSELHLSSPGCVTGPVREEVTAIRYSYHAQQHAILDRATSVRPGAPHFFCVTASLCCRFATAFCRSSVAFDSSHSHPSENSQLRHLFVSSMATPIGACWNARFPRPACQLWLATAATQMKDLPDHARTTVPARDRLPTWSHHAGTSRSQ